MLNPQTIYNIGQTLSKRCDFFS